jgi:hypothetical protein
MNKEGNNTPKMQQLLINLYPKRWLEELVVIWLRGWKNLYPNLYPMYGRVPSIDACINYDLEEDEMTMN